MVLAMSRPVKNSYGVYYFRKTVPKDLQPILGWEVKQSLRTKDPAEARERYAKKAAEVAATWKALRSEAVNLSHKQIVALSGIAYRELIDLLADEPGETSIWDEVLRLHKEAGEAGLLEQWFGPTVDDLLLRQGLKVLPESRDRLLNEVSKAIVQASEQKARESTGDYRPDPDENRFPTWMPLETTIGKSSNIATGGSDASLIGLVDGWWVNAQRANRSISTYESYRNTFKRFSTFLGHDDARRVTADDVISYKDHRLTEVNPKTGKLISPRTIKDSDLAALKSVFKWAVGNKKVSANPAADVSVIVGQRLRLRDTKGYTDAEAKQVLAAVSHLKRGQEKPHTFAAKKWVPWLCAYTGARVGEMVQLRKEDVTQEDGYWVVRITPEAGRVKNKKPRKVVLHSHLVELGFPSFVENAREGYLFLSVPEGEDSRGRWRSAKNRLREFIRTIIDDPEVQPNHAWRHRFKTVAIEVGVDARTRDGIQGHAPRTEGEDYGDVTVKAQARELAKMPWYEV